MPRSPRHALGAILLAPALVLLPSAAPSVAPPAALDAARITRAVDAYVDPFVRAGHFAGQIVVSKEGVVLVDRAYGLAHRELGVAMTPETRLNVASITKPMTIIVLTRLVEQGRLALSDSLGKWIPGFPEGRTITVDMLLRHRAGIPHRVTDDADEAQLLTARDVVERAKTKPLLFPPGTSSSYSSAGFTILTRILELAAGEPYADLVARHVFAPAGMTHSFEPVDRALQPGRAPSYVPGLRGIENAPLKEATFLAGAGSVFSTARDLHAFGRRVVDGGYGEGARQSWIRGGRMALNGSTNGYRAFVAYDSTTGVLVTLCANTHSGANDLLREALPRLAAGEPLPPPPLPPAALDPVAHRAKLAPAAWRRIEGAYQLANGTRLELRERDGVLAANEWLLVPEDDSTFFSLRDYGRVRTVTGTDGSVQRLDWTVGEQTWPAPRVAP